MYINILDNNVNRVKNAAHNLLKNLSIYGMLMYIN